MKTFYKLILFFIILAAGFAGLAFYWTFYKPLPDYETDIAVPQIRSPVDIHRDEFGVPHIYSENEPDLYFALGFAHAQDRLWQMTLSQISAEGRFAEFFGPEYIALDKHQRMIGFWETAQEIEQTELNTHEQAVLQAYADGINYFTEQNHNRLPVEFALTGVTPLRWTPAHSIAVLRLLGWELNVSWWSKITYGYLKAFLPPEKFSELKLNAAADSVHTAAAREEAEITAALLPLLQQEQELRRVMQNSGTYVGSNAWVADASKTATGYPLLAGDLHLGLNMPGKWYEVHLNLNGKNMSGAAIPGVPGIILGQNDQIAWTLTNVMTDDTDFFLEKTDPEDRSRYIADSLNNGLAVYEPFRFKREIIKVKGEDDEIFEIRYTGHGPVVTDIYPNQALPAHTTIAMQWTGREMSNEFRTLYNINHAAGFQDFQKALQHFGVPAQNFMYADKAGNIAMLSAGYIPVRQNHNILLSKGWDSSQNWQGRIPQEEMLRIINPESGWIAHANNKPAGENYPQHIAAFWEPQARLERISGFLAQTPELTSAHFEELQNDNYSKFAEYTVPVILSIIKNQSIYSFDEAVSYLENWDYKYDKNATAASIFEVFLNKLVANTFKDEMGSQAFGNFINMESIPVRTVENILTGSSTFFDDVTTPVVETKTDIVVKSMQDALFFLSDSLGQEPSEWRWEQLHTLTLAPPLLNEAARSPGAAKRTRMIVKNILSSGPYPMPGSGLTVNKSQYSWQKPYTTILGPSIRRIADLSDLGHTLSVLPAGQSGNPFSKHYGDQTELWLNGSYRKFFQDSTLFRNAKLQSMRLLPE